MKKALAITLSAAMILALAACGSKPAETQAAAPAATEAAQTQAQAAPAETTIIR